MTRVLIFIGLLVTLSCQKREHYRIQIPEATHITSETILTELENEAIANPQNERLVNQQLYFCEQLNWPARCEKVLQKARDLWGLDEKLLDQYVAYYLRHEEHDRAENLLQGKFETRHRMEARINIASSKGSEFSDLLKRYLNQYQDLDASLHALRVYMKSSDTLGAIEQFQIVEKLNPHHRILKSYVDILEAKSEYSMASKVIENQLLKTPSDTSLIMQLAINYHQIGRVDSATNLLRNLRTENAKWTLHKWFYQNELWDSSLYYLNDLISHNPEKLNYLLAKARSLERKGWVTPSLPYYERVLKADTSNLELATHVQMVRRKVAYLLQKKEREIVIPPPVERKTAN